MWQRHSGFGRHWAVCVQSIIMTVFGVGVMSSVLALPANGKPNVPVEVQQCGYIGCWQDNNVRSTPHQAPPQKPSLPNYVGYAWIGDSNQVYTTKSYFYDSRQAEELARLYIAGTALSECVAKHGKCDKGGMLPLDAVTFGTHWLVVANAGTDNVFFGNWQSKKTAREKAIANCKNFFWQHANKGVRPENCQVIQTVGIKRYSSSEEHKLLQTWKQKHFGKQ